MVEKTILNLFRPEFLADPGSGGGGGAFLGVSTPRPLNFIKREKMSRPRRNAAFCYLTVTRDPPPLPLSEILYPPLHSTCYIYVFLGTNTLSVKLGWHNIVPIFSNRYQMVRSLFMEFAASRTRLLIISNKVIICELTGINLWLYNSPSLRTILYY